MEFENALACLFRFWPETGHGNSHDIWWTKEHLSLDTIENEAVVAGALRGPDRSYRRLHNVSYL